LCSLGGGRRFALVRRLVGQERADLVLRGLEPARRRGGRGCDL
jgi:hypothetical protein